MLLKNIAWVKSCLLPWCHEHGTAISEGRRKLWLVYPWNYWQPSCPNIFFCISLIACKCISVEHGIIINVRIDRCHSVCWILHKWRILVSWCKVTHCEGICFLYSSELSDEYFTCASFMHLCCICHVIAQHCAYISLQTYITGILVSCWNGIMEY